MYKFDYADNRSVTEVKEFFEKEGYVVLDGDDRDTFTKWNIPYYPSGCIDDSLFIVDKEIKENFLELTNLAICRTDLAVRLKERRKLLHKYYSVYLVTQGGNCSFAKEISDEVFSFSPFAMREHPYEDDKRDFKKVIKHLKKIKEQLT